MKKRLNGSPSSVSIPRPKAVADGIPLPSLSLFLAIHYALRGCPEETVMSERNLSFSAEEAVHTGEGTPEQRRTLDQLFSLTYEELRRLASSVRRGDPSATLTPTALVNEVWIKLANSAPLEAGSQLHFKRIAARAMRQLLVEAARRRNAHKRNGDNLFALVTFDESVMQAAGQQDVLALDAALDELAKIHPRQALMVETRFFGGLDVAETATLLDVSEATILRDWRAAKAWLARELKRTH